MGYMHMQQLYKSQEVLLFKQVYVTEKIHGTSAHVLWKNGQVTYFSGGASHGHFVSLFNQEAVKNKFIELYGQEMSVCVYGEAYGGNMQAMSHMYGKELKFIVFDVEVDEVFVDVPTAERIASKLGLEFVDYVLVDATIENIDKERKKESTQAIRNGCGPGHKREGVVIHPPIEVKKDKDARIIVKWRNEDFEERKTPQKIADPSRLQVLADAEKIADEWVTANRLGHILDKLFPGETRPDISNTKQVIQGMIEDITREAQGEIVDSKEARNAISKKTAQMFKAKVQAI